MKVFDLGVEQLGQKPEALKALVWPVNAWACYVPDNLVSELNIFEKLILTLIHGKVVKSKNELKNILSEQIGLNKVLVENVVNECCKKYTKDSERRKELELKVDAIELLEKMENGISLDMKMSDTLRKVYLFQDLVTNTVVPCFNINNLPEPYEAMDIDEANCVQIDYNDISTQPKTSSVNNALYYWARIQKDIRTNDVDKDNSINLSSSAEKDEFAEESDKITTLSEKESKSFNLEHITIYDDEPTKMMLKGYLYFNPENPEDVEVISPFGSNYNNWFKKIVNRVRAVNEQFNEELHLFLDLQKEENKDKIAFNNTLNVDLFDEFPLIINESKYHQLKEKIESLTKNFISIKNGDGSSEDFVGKLRIAIEAILKEVQINNKSIYKIREEFHQSDDYRRYKLDINQTVSNLRLSEDVARRYIGRKIFEHVKDIWKQEYSGNPKDCVAILLVYANRHKNSPVNVFVDQYRDLLLTIPDLCDMGSNNALHYNGKTLNLTVEEVENYYADYENIVRAIFPLLIEGENNG